jgi:hypothetical protein
VKREVVEMKTETALQRAVKIAFKPLAFLYWIFFNPKLLTWLVEHRWIRVLYALIVSLAVVLVSLRILVPGIVPQDIASQVDYRAPYLMLWLLRIISIPMLLGISLVLFAGIPIDIDLPFLSRTQRIYSVPVILPLLLLYMFLAFSLAVFLTHYSVPKDITNAFVLGGAACGLGSILLLWLWSEFIKTLTLGSAYNNRVISSELRAKGYVRSQDVVDRVPSSLWRKAVEKYQKKHSEDALIYNPQTRVLSYSNASQIQALNSAWAGVRDALENHQTSALSKYRGDLTENFCHLLSFATPNGESDQCDYRYLYAYRLDTSPTFQDVRLPTILPFVFLQRAELLEGDLDDLRHLLSEHFRHRFALLVLFSDELGLERARRMLDEKLRKVYAYDVIALGREDLQQIIVKKDPQRALRQLVLRNVDLIAVSPFITSGPVPDNMFFGREQELREITEHTGTTSYALVGGRRVGKTSILQRLDCVRLPAAGYSTLYFDYQPYPTSEEFLRAAYQRWMKERLPNDSALPPFTDIVDHFAGDEPLIILLDEIDRLAMNDAVEGSPLFSTFRALSQSGRCQFVICGERALSSKLRDADSPLFNFCNEMLIGMLDYRAVGELVTKPFKQLEIELVNEQELVQRIYAFSSGHPNVVQRLCQRLVEQLDERQTRQLTVKDVDIVVSDPKFQRDSRDIFWERATVLEKLTSLVMAEDQSCCSVDDVREALARHGVQASFRQVDGALERLVDLRSILRRTVEGYEFAVTAFPRILSRTTTIHNAIEYQKEVFEEIGDEVEI